MTRSCRIRSFLRGRVLVEPLDGRGVEEVEVAGPDRFIEGEILTLGPPGPKGVHPVLESRIDPRYAPGPRPELVTYEIPGIVTGMGRLWAVRPAVPEGEDESFRARVLSGEQDMAVEARACRQMLERHPIYPLALHYLGLIAWYEGERERSTKYLRAALECASMAVPEKLAGRLSFRHPWNTALYGAGTALAQALVTADPPDVFAAAEILSRLHELDDEPFWDRARLRLPVLLSAGREADVRRELATVGHPDLGEFVRALLSFSDGREREAARAVVRGLRGNPLVIRALLRDRPIPDDLRGPVPVLGYDSMAELHAHLLRPVWEERDGFRFLARLVRCPTLRRSLPGVVDRAARSAEPLPIYAYGEFTDDFPGTTVAAVAREFALDAGRPPV